jgi:hypothetical protein
VGTYLLIVGAAILPFTMFGLLAPIFALPGILFLCTGLGSRATTWLGMLPVAIYFGFGLAMGAVYTGEYLLFTDRLESARYSRDWKIEHFLPYIDNPYIRTGNYLPGTSRAFVHVVIAAAVLAALAALDASRNRRVTFLVVFGVSIAALPLGFLHVWLFARFLSLSN